MSSENEGQKRPLRDRAITGAKNFRGQSLEDYAKPGRGLLGQLAWRSGVVVPALDAIAPGDPLPAVLYRDQWIISCPDCGSASYVWPETPLFLCAECFNGTVGGLWRRVALPAPEVMEAIEEVVGHRPLPAQRNWEPGETVAALRNENRQKGDYVPPVRTKPGGEPIDVTPVDGAGEPVDPDDGKKDK